MQSFENLTSSFFSKFFNQKFYQFLWHNYGGIDNLEGVDDSQEDLVVDFVTFHACHFHFFALFRI